MPPHRVAITFEPPPVRPVLPVERFVGEGLPELPEYVLVAHEAIHRVPELFPDGAMDTPETDRRQLLELVLATLPFLEPSPVLRDFVPGFYGVGGVEGHPEKDAPRVGVVLGDRAFEPAQGAAKAVTETGSIVQPPSFALKESHVRDPSIMLGRPGPLVRSPFWIPVSRRPVLAGEVSCTDHDHGNRPARRIRLPIAGE